MISLKRHSSRPVLTSNDKKQDAASNSDYADPGARRIARGERWTGGFLSANGNEIPLFVPPLRLLTK